MLYLDGSEWTSEQQKIADALFKEAGLPSNMLIKFTMKMNILIK